MKKRTINTISDRMANVILLMKSEEDYTEEKKHIADAFQTIVNASMAYGDGLNKMGEWGNLLQILSSYQHYINVLHEEANL